MQQNERKIQNKNKENLEQTKTKQLTSHPPEAGSRQRKDKITVKSQKKRKTKRLKPNEKQTQKMKK